MWRALIVGLAFFSALPAAAAPSAPSTATIERVVRKNVAEGFSGTVLVAKGDRVIFDRGYGSVHGVRMRPDTRYWISSTGKQFVAAAVLLLQREERAQGGFLTGGHRTVPPGPIVAQSTQNGNLFAA